ncbi:hypothetical protein RJ640_008971 [Escallonia rubra]|uniref:Vacuolar protein sorting-associated protein 51 homolog n=1 Tax=Escallonia rubra TaxID=112253 RepID=A0AA88SKX2_9ASTE|nr:hypothetical protein RJ640_008971 [Escallonia rubra]
MGTDDEVPMDDKAKRMRDLLSSFYSPDPSSAPPPTANASSRYATLDTINTTSFDPNQYMNLLVQKSNLEGLLQQHVEMAAEIKNLDTDLQMLVYENYNKFISATDTIKRMKTNIVGMEANMEQLLEKIMSVQSRSDGVNTSLFEKREHVEKLHRTRNLLRKVQLGMTWPCMSYTDFIFCGKEQFIFDLPTRLGKCIKAEAYADAVRFYTGAMPIFKGKVFSDSESIQARAEAVMLLKQLDFPVDTLRAKLLEKLEQFLLDLHLESTETTKGQVNPDEPSKQGNLPDSAPATAHGASTREFVEAVRAYRAIFPDSEKQLIKLVQDLVTKSAVMAERGSGGEEAWTTVSGAPADIPRLRLAWHRLTVVCRRLLLRLRRALNHKTKIARAAVHSWRRFLRRTAAAVPICVVDRDGLGESPPPPPLYPSAPHRPGRACLRLWWLRQSPRQQRLVALVFVAGHVMVLARAAVLAVVNGSGYGKTEGVGDGKVILGDALTNAESRKKNEVEEYSLQVALEASKRAVIQGSMDVLLGFRQLLDEDLGLLMKLRDLIIDWVQEGFQDFFRKLDDHFLLLSGKKCSATQGQVSVEGIQGEKVLAGLVLVMAQLSVFVEQNAIPRITEARFHLNEIAASFSGGGVRGYEYGPAFVPAEICRTFRAAGEKFLHLHKEPREVHMFVDLFLQELEVVVTEVKQILPQGLQRKHHRTDSNGSTTSSRSNPLRDDKMGRSNTHRARSQLLETHLAKLFKQKMEIFTKVEHTQESVLTTVIKLCLKSLQEFVRLQTFNRSGFQQIQLDIQFLRTTLKETAEDEAAVDFLLDEVIVAAAERCLDPIPLEQPILDKLIQAKLAKTSEKTPI